MTSVVPNRSAALQIPLRLLLIVRPRRIRFNEREFWWTQALVAIATVVVYSNHMFFGSGVSDGWHDVPPMLYIAPVMYAALAYGREGAVLTSLWALLLAAPHMVNQETELEWVGTLGTLAIVTVAGAFLAFRVERERDERLRAEAATERLRLLNDLEAVFDRGEAVEPLLRELADRLREGLRLDFVWVRYKRGRDSAPALFVMSGDPRKLGTVAAVEAAAAQATQNLTEGTAVGAMSDEWHVFPLSTERRFLGALGALRLSAAVASEERDVLGTAAAQVSVALENQELQRERREALTLYARQVTAAQEDERRRIARELHDGVTQALSGLCRGLDVLHAESVDGNQPADEMVADLRTVAEQALVDLRRTTRDLRPTVLDDLGLIASLEWLASDLRERSGLRVTVTPDADLPDLTSDQELGIFRIVQEALSNVEKHAGASRTDVTLESVDGALRITVRDDGVGFDVPVDPGAFALEQRYGVLGMRERAALHEGALTIRSEPGQGTVVELEIRPSPAHV